VVALERFRPEARRAVLLAYHIGQRRGDLAALAWSAYDGARITLMPEKTAKSRQRKGLGPLRIPVHDALRTELAAWRAENAARQRPAMTILTGPSGAPWGREALSAMITAEVRRVGLRPGLSLHGFRKLAAVRLAEAGATTSEIAAALGWETLAHVELYTRAADQERLAEAAILRLSTPLARIGKRDGRNK
jgi:integrase